MSFGIIRVTPELMHDVLMLPPGIVVTSVKMEDLGYGETVVTLRVEGDAVPPPQPCNFATEVTPTYTRHADGRVTLAAITYQP